MWSTYNPSEVEAPEDLYFWVNSKYDADKPKKEEQVEDGIEDDQFGLADSVANALASMLMGVLIDSVHAIIGRLPNYVTEQGVPVVALLITDEKKWCQGWPILELVQPKEDISCYNKHSH